MSDSEYYTIPPFELTYNGHDADDYGGWLATVPKLTHSTINRDRFVIPSRDGELLGAEIQRSNAHIVATFHAKDNQNFAHKPLMDMQRWLSGTGILHISDCAGDYEVLAITITDETKKDSIYGRLTVDFEIYPYEYQSGYSSEVTTFPIVNNYDESMPLYKIESTGGSGTTTGTLTVNGHNMTYSVEAGKPLFIDTRRMVAYDSTGANKSRYVNGDYDDYHLLHGSNTISCANASSGSSLVHSVKVTPRWGYFI